MMDLGHPLNDLAAETNLFKIYHIHIIYYYN